jgi:hypothetical protein
VAQLGNLVGNVHGIDFYEDSQAAPSPDESFSREGARVMRSLWFRDATLARRQAAAESLLGYDITVVGFNLAAEAKTFIRRRSPHGYPASTVSDVNPAGVPHLYAQSITRGVGIGTPGWDGVTGATDWSEYRFQVLYQSLPYEVLEDDLVLAPSGQPLSGLPDEAYHLAVNGWTATRNVSRHIDESARVVTIPQGYMKYEDASDPNQPVPAGFPVSEFQAVVRYHWWNVPVDAYPKAGIVACSNCVNDAEFDGFATDTLLFQSARKTPRRGPLGNRLLDIEYTMLYRPNVRRNAPNQGVPFGPNAILRVSGGVLDYQYVNSSGTPDPTLRPALRADFQQLFRPDP